MLSAFINHHGQMTLRRQAASALWLLLLAGGCSSESTLEGSSPMGETADDGGSAPSGASDVPGGTTSNTEPGGAGSGGAGSAEVTGGQEPIAKVPGFWAEYFSSYRELSHSGTEETIDHLWAGDNSEPFPQVGTDRFSARYTASLMVPRSGTYSFATLADDGVRLWVNSTLVIDDWRPHVTERHTGDIELHAGSVALTLEYYEADFDAELRLFWTPPDEEESLLGPEHVTSRPGRDEAPKPPYRNAVIKADRPDPGVLADGNPPTYYMVSTGGKFPIRRSYDLVLWEDTGAVVLPDGKPSWAQNGARNWAPELHRVGDKYVVYYTSVNGNNVLSVGAASADSPTGTFTDIGHPLVEHAQGVIDANYFEDDDGRKYLSYKIDGNSVGQPTPIYLRELAADGLSFLSGSEQVEILRNDSSTWEGGVVEAQWLTKVGDTYFLFYSGNVYDYRYRTGVARASSLNGPFEKHGAPLLSNNDTWVGPGHGSVVPAGDKLYYVYHAWQENGSGQHLQSAGRHVLVDRINFEEGWPNISDGTPSRTLMPWPGQ